MSKRLLKWVLLGFIMLSALAPLAGWSACSSLINLATINEIWRQSDNAYTRNFFYEIKVLDPDIISTGEYRNWNLRICRQNRYSCTNTISLNSASVSNGVYLILDENDLPRGYSDFGEGLEVSLFDGSGNIIDYLSVGGYSRLGNQGCNGFLFDTTAATSNTKDLRRQPDGTGDWEQYPGASGGDTEGGSNDGGQGFPALSFQDIQVAPGQDAVATLSLSSASGSDITINYTTYDGTATAGNDYVAAAGSITIPAGDTSATLTIQTLPAATVGEYFHFLVTIETSSAGVATIADHTGTVTFYTVPSPVAEWQFEEPAWSGAAGEVTDSTGNGLDGTSYNGANTSNAIPPGSAITGDPGTCRFGDFDGSTYVEVPDNGRLDLRNSLTVTAWINPNRYPSSDLMTILSKDENYEFHLKPSGVVNWWWNDSRGRTRQFDSTISVPLDQWTHVAIVYSQTGQTIYINGQARGSVSYANESLMTNNDPLQISEDQLIGGGRRRFDGQIDEVRIYDAALPASEIVAIMNDTHPCTATTVDHFDISFGAGSASTCTPLPVTITALDAANNVLTQYTGGIGISTSAAHGDWSATDAGGAPGIDPPVNAIDNAVADDGEALYLFDANDQGSIDLFLSNIHADDLTVAVADLATGSTTISAPVSFRDNAFVISPVTCTGSSCPATGSTELVAGRDHQFTAALWRRDSTSGDCAIATAYDTGSNPAYGQLQAWISRDVSDPAGSAPAIGTTVLPSAVPGMNNLNLNFVSGVASFVLGSNDVGKYAIALRDNSSGFATAADGTARSIDGSSDTLTVRPFAFGFTDITSGGTLNPGGTSTGGAAFTTAGEDFSATVGAYLWQGSDDLDNNGLADNNTTDVTDNGVTPAFNAVTVLSADNTAGSFTPVAGVAGIIGGANTLSGFSGGMQVATGLTYSEVGSIMLLAQSNDYLGTAGVNVAGRTVGPVGRFYPHYFDVTNAAITPACSTGGFSYMDQPELGIQYTVEAHRKGGGITLNYFTTGYTTGTVWMVAEDSNDGVDLSARLSNTGASSWIAGAYNLSTTTAQFDRAVTADGPFDALRLGVRVSDPDGTELLNRDMKADDATDCVAAASCTARALASTQVRYGRMEIANAHGSELLPLSEALYMTYYDGSGFMLNAQDNCTSLAASDLILANDIETNQRDGTIQVGSGTSTVSVHNSPAAAGRLDLDLTAPGSTGYIDIQPDLSTASGAGLPWLQYDWDGDAATADEAPTGRATFGIFEGNPQQIYMREQY